MDLLKSCLPTRSNHNIYLIEDDDDLMDNEQQINKWCVCHCLPKKRKEGLIQLPEGNVRSNRQEFDLQAELDRQEHDINDFLSPFSQEGLIQTEYSPLSRNIAQYPFLLEEEEDAQSLSEHRITAIIDERPKKKVNSARTFNAINIKPAAISQQLSTISLPPITNINTSNRNSETRFSRPGEPSEITIRPIIPGSVFVDSPTELVDTRSFTAALENTAVKPLQETMIPPTTVPNFNKNRDLSAAAVSVKIPYQPSPPMQYDLKPSSLTSTHSLTIPGTSNARRPSAVAAAQSLIGNKIEGFTEKFALFKKNINTIANGDSSDSSDNESVHDDSNHYHNYNTSEPRDKSVPWESFVAKFNKQSSQSSQSKKQTFSTSRPSDEFEEGRESDFYDEELFDFSKVAAVGKNLGSGFRNALSSLSTKIKNTQLPTP
ncbi:hypothetical protein G6F43_006810 [Rhizopus delemar]|nr:hypothetical protein G6F43_006810 [Rhizopus delemar]